MPPEVSTTGKWEAPLGVPRSAWWCGVGISLLTFAVYFQIRSHSFCSFDEPMYLLKNSMLNRGLTWEGVRWAFVTFYDDNYNPIPWLTHMLDVSLFGLEKMHAGPQKLMSLGYHVLAMWMLLIFLVRATGSVWRSVAVAALFALHPLHVEAVAFVIARKDVLAALFGFMTMLAYLRYTRRPGAASYGVVVLLAALAMLSKATMMTLPCVLMLLDFWPLRRWCGGASEVEEATGGAERPSAKRRALWWIALEKAPLLAMSIAVGVVALMVRHSGERATEPLISRFENTAVNYVRYAAKMFWPADLCYFYPIRPWPTWQVASSVAILLVISGLAASVYKRSPAVLMGWFFFLGTLVPVIGLIQVGKQAIADRYTCFPLTGLFIALAWSIPEAWLATAAQRRLAAAAGLTLLAVMAAATYRQAAFWRSDTVLYLHAQEVEPDSLKNLMNLSGQLMLDGKIEDARVYTTTLVKKFPWFEQGIAAHGSVLELLGRLGEAESVYRHGIEVDSKATASRSALANLLLVQGRSGEAAAELEAIVALAPADLDKLRQVAVAFLNLGRNERAVELLEQVLAKDPLDATSLNNLAACFDRLGRPRDAIAPLERAIALSPNYVAAHENLGAIYVQVGRLDDAARQYEWMIQRPNQTPQRLALANHRLGLLRDQAGCRKEAIACLRQAASLAPTDAEVRNDLGVVLANQGDFSNAAAEFTAALKADPNHADARRNLARVEGMLNRR